MFIAKILLSPFPLSIDCDRQITGQHLLMKTKISDHLCPNTGIRAILAKMSRHFRCGVAQQVMWPSSSLNYLWCVSSGGGGSIQILHFGSTFALKIRVIDFLLKKTALKFNAIVVYSPSIVHLQVISSSALSSRDINLISSQRVTYSCMSSPSVS